MIKPVLRIWSFLVRTRSGQKSSRELFKTCAWPGALELEMPSFMRHEETKTVNSAWRTPISTNIYQYLPISINIYQYLPIVGCPRLNKVDHSTSWDDWYYWHTDSCLRCGVCPVSSVRVFKRSLKIWSDLLTTCNSLLCGCTCINLYHVVSCCSIAKEHHKTDSHLSGDDKFGGFHSTRGDEGSHASDLTVQGIRARGHRSASKKRFILCFVWFTVVCLPTFGLATNCTSFFFPRMLRFWRLLPVSELQKPQHRSPNTTHNACHTD